VSLSDVLSVAALVVACGAAGYARRQAKAADKANRIPVLLDFLREYRSLLDARRYVYRSLKHGPENGVRELPSEDADAVEQVIHYLDHLGFAVHNEVITAEDLRGYMGGSVVGMWDELREYIEEERKQRTREGDNQYAGHFERLARRLREPADSDTTHP
jgi:hypothetical protein